MNVNVEIREFEEVKLIGITQIGEFDKTLKVYNRLFKWAKSKGLLDSAELKVITIYHDNPYITEMSKVRWSACITVDKIIETEMDIRSIMIEKGRYAISHFEISPKLFKQAWESTLSWVKENGYIFDDRVYFELFHNDCRKHPEKKFIADICIPIK